VLIVNGRGCTGVEAQPWAEAVLTRGDRIVAVGPSAEVRAMAGASARVIDAAGRLVIPGINDAHSHPGAAPPHTLIDAPAAMQEDPPLDVVLERLKATIQKSPGRGWVRGEIGGRVLEDPRATRALLDPVTGDRPVMLEAWHGHGAILNTAAMRALGIGEEDPDPPGGFYGRSADGRTLTGLAHEYAVYRIFRSFAALADSAARRQAFVDFGREAASFGITSVQAMMTSSVVADAAPAIAEAALPIRLRLLDFPPTSIPSCRMPASRHASSEVI